MNYFDSIQLQDENSVQIDSNTTYVFYTYIYNAFPRRVVIYVKLFCTFYSLIYCKLCGSIFPTSADSGATGLRVHSPYALSVIRFLLYRRQKKRMATS